MGNSSKSVLLMGAVIIAVLVMAVGMYIYSSAQSTISSSDSLKYSDVEEDEDDDVIKKANTVVEEDDEDELEDEDEEETVDEYNDRLMSIFAQQEIDAYNNNFLSYGGNVIGSNINSLLTRLVANAKTYRNELEKIPYVCYCNENGSNTLIKPEKDNSTQQNYIDDLTLIKNKIEIKHTYYVDFSYQENGLIDYIHIFYEKDEDATLMNR